MTRWLCAAVVVSISLLACDSPGEKSAGGRGVARMVENSVITIAITSEDNKDQLDLVLSGASPKTFHWVAFQMPASAHDSLVSAEGITLDLKNAESNVQFSQVYRETCNPAKEDFSPCWIYEQYLSGQTGLSGSVLLRVADTQVFGSYDVSWEGLTDRFGEPIQQYSHQTIGSVGVTLLDGESQ